MPEHDHGPYGEREVAALTDAIYDELKHPGAMIGGFDKVTLQRAVEAALSRVPIPEHDTGPYGTLECPSCGGWGTIQSADNFPECSLCYGSGRVSVSTLEREIASERAYAPRRAEAWQRALDKARRTEQP